MKRKKTLMRAIMRTGRAWNNHVREIALAEGIPDSYRPLLMMLYRHPGSTQRTIAEFADVTTSAVNQVVKCMAEEEYLRKESDPTDKRSSRLYLTDKGLSVAERLIGKLEISDDAITTMIGKEKEEELIALLDSLSDFIRKDLGGC